MSLKVPSTASSWSTENKNNKNEKSRIEGKKVVVVVEVVVVVSGRCKCEQLNVSKKRNQFQSCLHFFRLRHNLGTRNA